MKRRSLILTLAFACLVPSLAIAQSGPNGFDWIGTDPTNVNDQRCFDAHLTAPGGFSRPITTWTPPAHQGQNAQYYYTPQEFRAVIGSYNSALDPEHPSTNIYWELFVYDSFDRFRENANQNFRARYTFDLGSSSIEYGEFVGCKLYNLGYFYDIPCYHMTLDLRAPSSVQYKTATGEVTQTPPAIVGGQKYYFSLVGWPVSIDNPCLVRTNAALPGSVSETPVPMPLIAMTEPQCEEASMDPGCIVPVATSDFLKITPSFGCDEDRSFVNPSDPHYPEPRFVNVYDGSVPLSCGGGTHQPCCERAMKPRWAYALRTTRILRKLHYLTTNAARPVIYCPDC